MSVLRQYALFALLVLFSRSQWMGVMLKGQAAWPVIIGVIIFLLLVALGMTVYVIWSRKREQKDRGNSPLL